MSDRLRAFIVDADRGTPAVGVAVRLIAQRRQQDDEGRSDTRRTVLGVYQSDHAGYMSIPVKFKRPGRLLLQTLAEESVEVDVTAAVEAPGEGSHVIVLRVPGAFPAGSRPRGRFPSVLDPDVDDWQHSPESFASKPNLKLGQGDCEDLLLSTVPESRFRFSHVIREIAEGPSTLPAISVAPCESPANVPDLSDFLCVRFGALVEYEMTWSPLGHSLGEIVYSLPLAPCESVKLAVIDWQRRDDAARGEDTSVAEELVHNQRRDRLLLETVRGAVREVQQGGSLMAGGGLAARFAKGVSGTFALGGAFGRSRGRRSVTADGVQRLADAVVQSSATERRLNSTVVVQASQAEKEVIETRTVANHNHCHALTVLYYEVLRHWRITTRVAHKQDVVLVKRTVYTFNVDFDFVRRHRRILEAALLDPSLRTCFDAIDREYCARLGLAGPGGIDAPADLRLESVDLRFRTGASGPPNRRVELFLVTLAGRRIPLVTSDGSSVDMTVPLAAGTEDLITLRPESSVRWGNLLSVVLSLAETPYPPGRFGGDRSAFWDLEHLRIKLSGEGIEFVVHDGPLEDGPRLDESRLEVTTPLLSLESGLSRGSLSPEARCCVQRLLDHLEADKLYYSRAIWLAEDPDERALWLDRYRFGSEEDGFGRLLDFVENRIVDVLGDYIVLPLRSSSLADTLTGEDPEPVRRVVGLPTRGVFAEAKLGHCNACEIRDVTRFWDWSESPCPTPPEISPVTAGSRRAPVDLTANIPVPGLRVELPPEAPSPGAIIQSVLDILARPDIFRDMSGAEPLSALLGSLVAGAVELEKARLMALTQPTTPAESTEPPAISPVGTVSGAGGAAPSPRPSRREPTPPELAHDCVTVVMNTPGLDPETRRRQLEECLGIIHEEEPREDGDGASSALPSSPRAAGSHFQDDTPLGPVMYDAVANVFDAEGHLLDSQPFDSSGSASLRTYAGVSGIVQIYLRTTSQGTVTPREEVAFLLGGRAPVTDRVSVNWRYSAASDESIEIREPASVRRDSSPRDSVLGTVEPNVNLAVSSSTDGTRTAQAEIVTTDPSTDSELARRRFRVLLHAERPAEP